MMPYNADTHRPALALQVVSSEDMTQDQLSDVIRLCSEVFEMDYGYFMGMDLARVHVLGYLEGRLIAHALHLIRRLRIGDGPWFEAAYVEGVATHPDFRARGFGSAIMRRMQQEFAGFTLGALSPAEEPWYARLGWVRWQGPLLIDHDGLIIPTPDETVLIYRTPLTGPNDVTASLTGEWRPFELW